MRGKIVHETAIIDPSSTIGDGTTIWQHCIIQEGVVIGNNCNIGANVYIEKGVKIGDGVKIKNNIAIYSGVCIEDDVFIGPNVVFTNVINPRSFINRKEEFLPTIIKSGATIGANATIICGNTIYNYAMIGAGAVVTKDVLWNELVVGNPAKRVGYVCKCGGRLNSDYVCELCGKKSKIEIIADYNEKEGSE